MKRSVQIDEDDGHNDREEKAQDNVHLNGEDAYECEKKSSNEEYEDLHSATNSLPRGQVKHQRGTTSIRYAS